MGTRVTTGAAPTVPDSGTGRRGTAAALATASQRIPARLQHSPALDRLVAVVARLTRPLAGAGRVRDALRGVWLGHPLHPVLVQVPVGAWLSAAVLDALPGGRRAATGLIAVGTAGAAPAALAGLTDWTSMTPEQQRVGVVHASANVTAVGLYAAGLAARLTGRRRAGRLLPLLGLACAGTGAFLGGHLTYGQAAGVNLAAADAPQVPTDWTELGAFADIPQRRLVTRRAGPVPVLVYRDREQVSVLLAHCAHQRGPLGEGELVELAGEACVVCPWHGSTFALRDGAVRRGPAASAQPALRSRVVAGVLSVRSA